MARKAGLDLAVDFTKFIIGLDGALIAFLTGASFVQSQSGPLQKTAVIVALTSLALSIVAGIFVYMRAATMVSDGSYDLNDKRLQIPGILNVVLFMIGALAIGSISLNQFQAGPKAAKDASATKKYLCENITDPKSDVRLVCKAI